MFKGSAPKPTKIFKYKVNLFWSLYSLEIQTPSLGFTQGLNFLFCQPKVEFYSAKRCYFKFNMKDECEIYWLVLTYIDFICRCKSDCHTSILLYNLLNLNVSDEDYSKIA